MVLPSLLLNFLPDRLPTKVHFGAAFDEGSATDSTTVGPIYIGEVPGASATVGGSLVDTGINSRYVILSGAVLLAIALTMLVRELSRRKRYALVVW